MISALGALGRIELARGDVDAAVGYLRELPRRLLMGGLSDPTLPVWADAIEALVAGGEFELASSYLKPFGRCSGTLGSPYGTAGVERCRGLLASASGDLELGLMTLERSLADRDRLPPLERGRTLLVLGTLRRRAMQKKACRVALDEAVAVFEHLGAALWLDRAHAELSRVSGRRGGGGDDLTETERRVAALAGEGLSNKQIASELYMGLSTVESHLSRVYRKLGIRSRAGLGTWVAAATDGAAKPVDGTPQS